jgi:glycosyltransferase involved in cell wall biosynthesis
VDDGSTDNTTEVVRQYSQSDSRIEYILQPNGGLSSARNTGIATSAGNYLQFLDADDLLEPRKLEYHIGYLEGNPDVDIVYGDARYFRTTDPTERRYSMLNTDKPWMPKVSGKGMVLLNHLLHDNIMVVSAPMLRRKSIHDIGYFDTGLLILQDWDYWIRCVAAGYTFDYLDQPETHSLIRWHPKSLSQNRKKMFDDNIKIRRNVPNIISDADALKLNTDHLIFLFGLRGVDEIKDGRLFPGIKSLLRAAAESPGIITKLKWCYWAALAPFVPKDNFQDLICAPVRKSTSSALRHMLKLD